MSNSFAWPSFANAVADVDAGAEQARQRAHDAGYQAGIEQAQAEQNALRTQLQQSLTALAGACQTLPDNQANAITALTFAVLEALLRVELKSNPALIESLVGEALQELGAELDAVTIHAHPADVSWLQGISEFEVVADDTVVAGGLSVRLPQVSVEFDLLGRLSDLSADVDAHVVPHPSAEDPGEPGVA
ncbi:MAG: FliH/SctL family protein [Gammaproteobacteria bacterium]|nr:FliH/SctL family protein [Gammaproteobacteria bacterium]